MALGRYKRHRSGRAENPERVKQPRVTRNVDDRGSMDVTLQRIRSGQQRCAKGAVFQCLPLRECPVRHVANGKAKNWKCKSGLCGWP